MIRQIVGLGAEIQLNDFEARVVRARSKAIMEWNKSRRIKSKKKSNQDSDLEIQMIGAGGELAFAKLFGVYPYLGVQTTSQLNDRGDCQVQGIPVDVKTTVFPGKFMNCVEWKNDLVQVYALMIVHVDEKKRPVFKYTYGGIMSRQDVRRDRYRMPNKHGPGHYYSVPREDLYDFDQYFERVQNADTKEEPSSQMEVDETLDV